MDTEQLLVEKVHHVKSGKNCSFVPQRDPAIALVVESKRKNSWDADGCPCRLTPLYRWRRGFRLDYRLMSDLARRPNLRDNMKSSL